MHEKVNGIALNFEEILSVGYIDITVKFCSLSLEQLHIRVGVQLEKSLLLKINFPLGPVSWWGNFPINNVFQLGKWTEDRAEKCH